MLDPALAVLITCYILYNVVRNLRRTLMLFMQAVPEEIDLLDLESHLGKLAHVRSTHHTHVWSMDGAHHVLTSHIVVDSQTTKTGVARRSPICVRSTISPTRRSRSSGETTSVVWRSS